MYIVFPNLAMLASFAQYKSGSVLLLATDIWTGLVTRLHIRKNGFIHNDAGSARSEILFINHKVNNLASIFPEKVYDFDAIYFFCFNSKRKNI